ncbi:hypothetical protein [Agromyces sp. PvR057]|uniref:hypothetical protein n=1 Tax=Agromyces sp. PvR057 TaxID=3156403 RepID=UPI003391EA04
MTEQRRRAERLARIAADAERRRGLVAAAAARIAMRPVILCECPHLCEHGDAGRFDAAARASLLALVADSDADIEWSEAA